MEGQKKPEFPMIYQAIANVIADVGAVGKDKINKQQGFKFRSVDDVYNALHPALAKNKVFIVPDILDRTVQVIETKNGTKMYHVTCRIKFTFFAEDGSSVESTLVGEALDTGDKATNKAMAIAYKYACFQVFCIPTEEMTDPDAESPEMEEGKKTEKKSSAKAGTGKVPGNSGKQTTDQPNVEHSESVEKTTLSEEKVASMQNELQRTGVKVEQILKLFKVNCLEDMTEEQYQKAMRKFRATPDREVQNE